MITHSFTDIIRIINIRETLPQLEITSVFSIVTSVTFQNVNRVGLRICLHSYFAHSENKK